MAGWLGSGLLAVAKARGAHLQGKQVADERQSQALRLAEAQKLAVMKQVMEATQRKQQQANADRSYGLEERKFEFSKTAPKAPVLGTPEYLEAQDKLAGIRAKHAPPRAPVFGTPEYLQALEGVESVKDRHQKSGSGSGRSGPEETMLPDGTVVQGKPPKTTEGEKKAAGMLHRATKAGERINGFDSMDALNVILSRKPLLGNWAKSKEGQMLWNSGKIWVQSVLRAESGATVRDEEMQSYFQDYLPQPGDSQELLAQKRLNRAEAEEAMRIQAGNAAPKRNDPNANNDRPQNDFEKASAALNRQYEAAIARGVDGAAAQAVLDRELNKLRRATDNTGKYKK